MSGRRNRSNGKPPIAQRVADRKHQAELTQALLRDAKIERMAQAEILEELQAKYYPAEVPVRELFGMRAR